MANTNKNINSKRELFCREYLIDLNATQAAIRAGYSEKTAYSQGQRLLKNVEIKNHISKLRQERCEEVKIDAAYVLRQAVKLHERCMQEVKVKKGGSGIDVDGDGNVVGVFEFNATGAAKALELIGKHVGVQAFKDNVNHSGEIAINWSEERTYETKS